MKWIKFWTADKSEHDPLKWMSNLQKEPEKFRLEFFYMQMLQVKSKFMLKFLTCNIDLILYP